jgi:hypothetical protein
MTTRSGNFILGSDVSPDWVDYSATFTLTATTTNPTKGNSLYVARYLYPSNGSAIDVEVRIDIGSTFAAGSGVYRFLLPFNANTNDIWIGSGYILDTGTANRQVAVRRETTNQVALYLNGALSGLTDAGSGTAWATGDIMQFGFRYQPA